MKNMWETEPCSIKIPKEKTFEKKHALQKLLLLSKDHCDVDSKCEDKTEQWLGEIEVFIILKTSIV